MKVLFKVFFLCSLLSVFSCGSDDMESDLGTLPPGTGGGGVIVKPAVDAESMKFVGKWYGPGPYGSSSHYGLVDNYWYFYNDGTYYWRGQNSYGFEYVERGEWHYNADKKLLITNGGCNIVWEIEDFVDGQWTGTFRSGKGTGVYKKRDTESVTACSPVISDIIEGGFVVSDTLKNYELCTENLKFGVCYCEYKSDVDSALMPRIYADSISADKEAKCTITGMTTGKEYRIFSFVQHEDGKVDYYRDKTIYKCVAPPKDAVFMGKNSGGKACFWAKKILFNDGTFYNGTDWNYDGQFQTKGDDLDVIKSQTNDVLKKVGDDWYVPTAKDMYNLVGSCNVYCENSNGDFVLKSKYNGNKLKLKGWDREEKEGSFSHVYYYYSIDLLTDEIVTGSYHYRDIECFLCFNFETEHEHEKQDFNNLIFPVWAEGIQRKDGRQAYLLPVKHVDFLTWSSQ